METKKCLVVCLFLTLCTYAASKRVNSRDGGQVYLSCDPGKSIAVSDVYYGSLPRGSKCDDPNALTIVQGLADGQRTYTLSVTDTTFATTTCSSTNREALQLTYSCVSNTQENTSNQGTNLTLTCTDGKVLLITKAVYADDAITCFDSTALTTAKGLCDGLESCSITVSDATFTSSTCAAGSLESLDISYLCSQVIGGIYTHWGGTCSDSKLFQEGYMAGAMATMGGSGSSWECFPDSYTPAGGANPPTNETNRGEIYGVELTLPSSGKPFETSKNNKVIRCAVCQLYTRNAVIMVPGLHTCPTGFTEQYKGYVVSAGSGNVISQDYICLDENVSVGSESSNNQGKAYPVQVKCGALGCTDYPDHSEIKCIVCSK